jgi:hypothetical protein
MRESDVAAVLKQIPVELGAGKTRVGSYPPMYFLKKFLVILVFHLMFLIIAFMPPQ